MKRRAYIARYPLTLSGDDLSEVIIAEDTFWSPALSKLWNELTATRAKSDPMLQGWYSDSEQATCMAATNQPFKLS